MSKLKEYINENRLTMSKIMEISNDISVYENKIKDKKNELGKISELVVLTEKKHDKHLSTSIKTINKSFLSSDEGKLILKKSKTSKISFMFSSNIKRFILVEDAIKLAELIILEKKSIFKKNVKEQKLSIINDMEIIAEKVEVLHNKIDELEFIKEKQEKLINREISTIEVMLSEGKLSEIDISEIKLYTEVSGNKVENSISDNKNRFLN